MTTKTLYVGPWIGEFGWEVGWWNPIAREAAQKYKNVVVACRSSSNYLYEYATKIIEVAGKPISTYLGESLKSVPPGWGKDGDVLRPNLLYTHKLQFTKPTNALYRDLSSDVVVDHNIDIMCAFRMGKDKKEYPKDLCDVLVGLLVSCGHVVGCFGTLADYCPEGAVDLRNQPLEKQCSYLSRAKCAIGHSSGTMHLASFCKCPHVVWHVDKPWLNRKTLKMRYRINWNPFNTPMKCMPVAIPEPASIVEEAQKL